MCGAFSSHRSRPDEVVVRLPRGRLKPFWAGGTGLGRENGGFGLRSVGATRAHNQSRHRGGGLFGESRYGVGVNVESNGDGSVAQAIGHHLGMNPSRESQSGMSVAQVVQMDLWQSGLLHRRPEGFAHPLGMDELAIGTGEH